MSSRSTRTTVDSLLRAVARTDSVAPAPRGVAGAPVVFAAQFELGAELGRGGMGVVYQAYDRRLDRDVAIKVMHPERWAHVPRAELVAVFEREARATARLSHPSIVTLHQTGEHDGTLYLVLELLRGANLGALARRPMDLGDALAIMIQVADAIAYAHGQGVLHRDLKPHNVFIGDGGRVWVLDFGLASLDEVGARDGDPGPRSRGGTPGYMAPEQRRGERQDARTDVWALGLLLYQLVTAYEPPPLASPDDLRAATWRDDLARMPASMAALVAAAVAWAPADRLPTAAAFAARLRAISPTDPERTAPRRRGARIAAPIAAVAAVGALGAGVIARPPRTSRGPSVVTPAPAVAFSFELAGASVPTILDNQVVAVAPGGASLAVLGPPAGGGAGATQIYTRQLADDALVPLVDTVDAEGLAFSPDGQWLAYTRDASLWKQALSGGAPIALAPVSAGTRGVTWLADGRVVVAPSWFASLVIVPAAGGAPVALTQLRPGEKSHRFPHALPDGRTVLFVTGTSTLGSFDDATIEAVDVATGARKAITTGGAPRFWAPGTLLVPRAGQLLALPFDPVRVEVTGPPRVVIDDLLTAPATGAPLFDASGPTLAYVVGDPRSFERVVSRVDPAGRAAVVPGPPLAVSSVRARADGRWLVVRADGANAALWAFDLERGTQALLTHGGDFDHPVLAPDGRTAYAVETLGAEAAIVQLALDGSGRTTPLYRGRNPANLELSVDGTRLIFDERDPGTGLADLWWFEPHSGRAPARYLPTPTEHETQPALSPDGRWLAYVSSDSGVDQIYVQAFPDPGVRVQVTTAGGTWPRWRPDGRALVFRGTADEALWTAPVAATGAAVTVGPATRWRAVEAPADAARRSFDLLADGSVVTAARPPGWRPASSVRVVRDGAGGR
ncbi:MAG: serine/threonine-protein kinase [Myxococcales bacterium]|nr:serine/threonine-protein kinase [Myxococcales bacterium]